MADGTFHGVRVGAADRCRVVPAPPCWGWSVWFFLRALGLGVEPEHVRVVVPLPKNMEEITRTIREEIEYNGVSVIIPRRECIQTLNRKLKQQRKNQ